VLTASAYRPLVQCQPSITEVSEQLSVFSHKWETVTSRGIWTILPHELQNFVSWPAEFGKIFRGKLCALLINNTSATDEYTCHSVDGTVADILVARHPRINWPN